MKFVRTIVVFDQGGLIDSEQWMRIHEAYTQAVQAIVHPPGNDRFVIRQRVRKQDACGGPTKQWFRNGVVPIKQQFLANLRQRGWQTEKPVSLKREPEVLDKAEAKVLLKEYPSKRELNLGDENWMVVFRQQIGDFDFYTELGQEMRAVIEWETGNISSSHRSMNKLCLVMLAGLIEIGIVILPSRQLYPHLTDRIGNWEELSPYMPLWHHVGQGVQRGLLAVTVVEHDELTDDPSVPFIAQGSDGRSAEGAAKLL
jgi:hypothetical protein